MKKSYPVQPQFGIHAVVIRMGTTPLMLAASLNHPAAVEYLINQGADVNAKDARGFTPMTFAIADRQRKKKDAIIQMLKKAGANP